MYIYDVNLCNTLIQTNKIGYLLPTLIQVRIVSAISQVNSVDSRLWFGFFMASAVKEYFRKFTSGFMSARRMVHQCLVEKAKVWHSPRP